MKSAKPRLQQSVTVEAGPWASDATSRCELPQGWELRIPGAIPGERLRAVVEHVSRGAPVAWGTIAEIEAASPHRRRPPCTIHGLCGACGIQQAADGPQFLEKVRSAASLLPAPLADVLVPEEEWLSSPRPFGYRHKAVLLPSLEPRRLVLGGFARGTHEVVDLSNCAVIADPLLACHRRLASVLRRLVQERTVALRSVVLRGSRSGEVLVTLVIRGGSERLLRRLARELVDENGPIAGVHLQVHDAPGDSVTGKGPVQRLAGRSHLDETVGGLLFRVLPLGFFQVNPGVLELLAEKLQARLTPSGPLLDLYCGGGVLGLACTGPTQQLTGVDSSKASIRAARLDAERNGRDAEFHVGSPSEVLPQLEPGSFGAALLDPPRAGVRTPDLQALIALQPERIVYVSCHGPSLARDASRLLEQGWSLTELLPADMLPQTPHVEWVATLQR